MSHLCKLFFLLVVTIPALLQAEPGKDVGLKELWERVEALESAFNERAGLVVKANGDHIGIHIEGGVSSDPLALLNPNGYIVRFNTFGSNSSLPNAVEGQISTEAVYFLVPDCLGAPFAGISNVMRNTGFVFRSGFEMEGKLYYVPGGSEVVEIDALSEYDYAIEGEEGCVNYTEPQEVSVSPAHPNDPSITGVYADTYPAPITLGQ